MQSVLDALRMLPDDAHITITVPVEELRAALRRSKNPNRLMKCRELAEELGQTPKWWAQQASEIEGARKTRGRGGPWRVPLGAAKRYLDRYWEAQQRMERLNGAATTSSAHRRTSAGETRPVVDGGSAALERTQIHAAPRSESRLVADEGTEDDAGEGSADVGEGVLESAGRTADLDGEDEGAETLDFVGDAY